MTKKDIKDLMRIGSAKPVKLEDLLGDNFIELPAHYNDRAEYEAREIKAMREVD